MSAEIRLTLYSNLNEELYLFLNGELIYNINADEKATLIEIPTGENNLVLQSALSVTSDILNIKAKEGEIIRICSYFDNNNKLILIKEQDIAISQKKKLENKMPFMGAVRIINLIGIVVIGLGFLEIFFGYFIKMFLTYINEPSDYGTVFVFVQFGSALLFFTVGGLIIKGGSKFKRHSVEYSKATKQEKMFWLKKKYKSASSVVYFIGGITVFWGIALYIFNEQFPKNTLGINNYYIYLSIVEGFIFLILGYFTRQKSNTALIIAVLIYGYDTFVYMLFVIGNVNLFYTLGLAIIFRIMFLFPGMIKGVYSIYQIKKGQ